MEMGKEFATFLLDEMDVEISTAEVPELSRQRMQTRLDKLRGIVNDAFGTQQTSSSGRGNRRGGGANA